MSKITLKAARVNANISQKTAAEALNIAPSTLRNWESGKSMPNLKHIAPICNLYGVNFDDIFFGSKSALS